ncbi:ABC transporter permease [Kitasatospora sp. NPDC057223]|uniref:ABC transporter permease n=1 Tax=Kitasatospora sp. NPDC057223 TaxID=3346055 RepID=UPI00363D394C
MSNTKTRLGAALLGVFVLVAVIGPWIAPHDPDARSADLLQGPSGSHWLGTTHLGQDVFSQLLVGTRSIMLVGLIAGTIATVLAVLVGVTSGYLAGPAGEGLSALSNVFLVIPALPMIIIIASVLPQTGDWVVALVIGLVSWAWGARILRAQALSLRRRDFVTAARATGESTWRIVTFEILPNLTAIIASSFISTMMYAVMTEISLAFIGIPGMSPWNWGVILYWAQTQQALGLGAWWWFVPAGLAIALLGTALSLVNFGIDEIVNPRLRTAGRDLRTPDGRVRVRPGFTPVVRTGPTPRPPQGTEGTTPVAADTTGAAPAAGSGFVAPLPVMKGTHR